MYPLIDVGPFTVASFPALLFAAFLLGSVLGTRQARFLGLEQSIVWNLLPWVAVAALAGAQLYSIALIISRDGASLSQAVAARGQVFYGGLIAGLLVAAWRFRRMALPLHWMLDYGAPCIAIAHAVGRVGCLLAGDDYGVASDAPWAVAFPQGAPPSTAGYLRDMGDDVPASIPDDAVVSVHPVQLYESAALLAIGMVLWRASRRPHAPFTVFAMYLIAYGTWRFGIEFLRPKNDHMVAGLTSAQLLSVTFVIVGTAILARARAASAVKAAKLH